MWDLVALLFALQYGHRVCPRKAAQEGGPAWTETVTEAVKG